MTADAFVYNELCVFFFLALSVFFFVFNATIANGKTNADEHILIYLIFGCLFCFVLGFFFFSCKF